MDSAAEAEDACAVGVCNCCLAEGSVRSMIEQGTTGEVCTQLMFKCFGLDVMAADIGDRKRLICCACERRLRDALDFREQVERALLTLQAAGDAEVKSLLLYSAEKDGKRECDDAHKYNADGFNCEDFMDGTEFLAVSAFGDIDVKNEEPTLTDAEEEVLQLTSSKRKTKSVHKQKKTKIKTDLPSVETMKAFLASGLFPFKPWREYHQCFCHKKFTNLTSLRDHIMEHTDTFKLGSLKKMIRYQSNCRFEVVSSTLRCTVCSEMVDNFESLERHIATCTKQRKNKVPNAIREKLPFKLDKDQVDCPVCHKRFLNYGSLNTHMNIHYPNYICESCGKAFANKQRLKSHMRIHELGEFPCRLCGMVFDKVTKRENHIAKQHKSGVRYSCPRCAISLTSYYSRQKHLADAHNEELKRYKCGLCPQSYITPGHLSSHVRRDHLNERNHRCDKCDLAFYTKHSLTMHMIKHDGARIYSCQVCAKSYQRAKTLKEHMRIHNNDKRFMCPVCGRAFTQKCTLKSHCKVHERKPEVADDGLEDGKQICTYRLLGTQQE